MPATSTPSRSAAERALFVSVLAVAFVAHGTALSALAGPAHTPRPAPAWQAVTALAARTTSATSVVPAASDSPLVPFSPVTVPDTPATQPVPASQLVPAQLVPASTKWIPTGKGMWIYEPAKTEGGNVAAIVTKAKNAGLTHMWVRLGSAWDGFNVAPFLDRLLPAAHAAGIKVIGWDFPKLDPVDSDVQRALTMIRHTAPTGDRIDAFSPDIETQSEGTHLSQDAALRYGAALRAGVGDAYTLIATVPRPSKDRPGYPFAQVTASFDAIAPMVYWLNRQPDTDVIGALADLAVFHKPILPVGQAYDGGPEGGRKGVPPPAELQRFMKAAVDHGATEVSFWSWQSANEAVWVTIRDAPQFGPAVAIVAEAPSP